MDAHTMSKPACCPAAPAFSTPSERRRSALAHKYASVILFIEPEHDAHVSNACLIQTLPLWSANLFTWCAHHLRGTPTQQAGAGYWRAHGNFGVMRLRAGRHGPAGWGHKQGALFP